MRVLVTGSRDWTDHEIIWEKLYEILGELGPFTLVHGDCPTGADHFANTWGYEVGFDLSDLIERHPADWDGPRKRGAGYARNSQMVFLGADICLAFIKDKSEGATHCAYLAEKAGIDTRIIRRTTVANRVENEVIIENATIIWQNFAGEERQFNAKGKRNFSVVLDEQQALEMLEIGWNVRKKEPIEDGAEAFYHLSVEVSFDHRPPRVFTITTNGRTKLDSDTIGLLDYLEFDQIDITLNPYNWKAQGKTGCKAYLKTGYFTLHQDPLDLKYADVPDADQPLAIENVIDVEGSEWVEESDPDMVTLGDIEQRDVRQMRALTPGQ